MKSLTTFIQENIDDKDMNYALKHNEVFYTSSVIESLLEDLEGAKIELDEASLKDLIKKWGFDLSEKIRTELELKSKSWKIRLSPEEMEELIKAGLEDGYRGGYKIKDKSEIVYVPWSELKKMTTSKNWVTQLGKQYINK